MSALRIFWFRRDLRLEDNCGLHHALRSGAPVLPIFIFDTNILQQLDNPHDRRVDYIQQAAQQLHQALQKQGSGLRTFFGTPLQVFRALRQTYTIEAIYCNRDYEPGAIKRDEEIKNFARENHILFHTYKDQVIFDQHDILKSDGKPYTVYTPYMRKWKSALENADIQAYRMSFKNFLPQPPDNPIHNLQGIGFEGTDLLFTPPSLPRTIIGQYARCRDYPATDSTTHLGIALRFGTISVRKCVKAALELSDTWLNELIWREFFMQILYHFPQVVHRCFHEKYERIEWRNNEKEFQRWCAGETGYPLVDAGMRQLNQTGFMHNRVRMVTASFLTKHLLVDWRWGEAYFASKLLDYDLAANNGNWQWAAGCGCDAAPYFRIFNPTEQTRKFDKDLQYVRQWNPDFEKILRPPVVDHRFARERALKAYKKALEDN